MTTATVTQDFSLGRLRGLLAGAALVRHDVDFFLRCAEQMAQLEADMSVKAYYLLRTDGVEYDISEAAVTADILLSLGHTVGLHVDLGFSRGSTVSDDLLTGTCHRDYRRFVRLFRPLSPCVTFHAPPADVLWRTVRDYDHLMDPRWRGCYVSDSRGVFRTSPEETIERRSTQINLHPEWWFLPTEERARLKAQEAGKP